MNRVKLSQSERLLVLEGLYGRLSETTDAYRNGQNDRRVKRHYRTRARAIVRLIVKLEGSIPLEVEI